MPVVPAWLHHVRPGPSRTSGFAFRRLDVRARHEYDFHRVGVRVKRSGESGRKLEECAERPLRMVAPQVRDLDAGSALRIEVGPFQVAERHEEGWPGAASGTVLAFVRMTAPQRARTGSREIENARTFLGLIEFLLCRYTVSANPRTELADRPQHRRQAEGPDC